ncbi:ribonucleoside-triphosphate reductase [archaeon]|nr:ribonucleoside-triphosphate reductase [archaeon]
MTIVAIKEELLTEDKLFSLIEDYLEKNDLSRHNANLIYSLPSMSGILSGFVQKEYYLRKILSEEERMLHEEGWWYHHQMSQLSPYCAGFSAVDIMKYGLQSLNNFSIKSRPPRHLRTFLDQSANFILKISQEVSGAVALNDLTSVAAAYVWYERERLHKNLTYDDIKNAFQSFVYNVNLDFRSGNSPFTNVTITIGGPAPALMNEPVTIGQGKFNLNLVTFGQLPKETYDEVNQAFFEVMAEGDAEGKPWTFPLITLYVTDDFDWDSNSFNKLLELMDSFGGIYLENYISKPFSDEKWKSKVDNLEARDPKLQRSFCCRFQVDLKELTRVPHTGSIFGNVSGVGSVGVISLNFNRLAYLHKGDLDSLLDHLDLLLDYARSALNKKRKFILENKDLYPTFFYYVDNSLQTYFNTISLGGGHEGLINFGIKDGILSEEGLKIAKMVARHILDKLKEFQDKDGIAWNFEYAPMETAAGYLARKDIEFVKSLSSGNNGFRMFKDIVEEKVSRWKNIPKIFVSASEDRPILTSGFQPPFSCKNISKLVYVSAQTQNYATGGSVLHLFLGEKLSIEAKKRMVRSIFSNYPVKYMTLTPTLTVCNDCKHKFVGEHLVCPNCGSENTTIYSRVIGYFRPIARKVKKKDSKLGLYEGEENIWQDSRRADWVTRGILTEDEINSFVRDF